MTVEDDGSADGGTRVGGERLLVVVSGDRDRELLADRLAGRYDVVTAGTDEDWPSFEACLVDADAFGAARDRLARARESRTTYLPVLLIVPAAEADDAWIDDALSGPVDDVLSVPARGEHLEARLESLLRIRRLSADLESERDRFRSLTESASDAIVTLDEDGIVRYANPSVESVFGYDPSELVGQPVTDLMPERLRDRHREGFDTYLDTGDRTVDWSGIEFPGLHADGYKVPLELSYADYHTERGQRFTGIIRDVTERKEREAELSASARAFRELYRVAGDTDRPLEAKIEAMLDVGAARLGLDIGFLSRIKDETQNIFVSRGTHELIQPGQTASLDRSYCRFTLSDDGHLAVYDARAEGWLDDPAYELYELESYVGTRVDVDGELFGTLAFADRAPQPEPFSDRDRAFVDLLSQWVAYEMERTRREEELAETLERITDAFFALDDEYRFTYVNDRAVELLEIDPEGVIGQSLWEAFPEAIDTTFEREYRSAMADQEAVEFEEYFEPLDTWFEVHAYPSDEGLSVYFRDVTDRKHRERELQRYVDLLDQAQELGGMGAWEYDLGSESLYWTDQMREIHGVDETFEPTLENAISLYPSDDQSTPIDAFFEILKAGEPASTELEYVTPDGEEKWLHVHAEPRFDDGDDSRVVGITHDVTDRHRQEKRLADALELLQQAQKIADIGAWEYDLRADEMTWTDELREILGVGDDVEATLERSIGLFPDDHHDALWQRYGEILETGEPREIESPYVTPDGEEKWLQIHGEPFLEDGEVVRVVGSIQDVTEPLQREEDVRRYETMMEEAANPIYALDEDGYFTHVNEETAALADCSPQELVGRHAVEVFGEEIVADVNDRIRELLDRGERTTSLEVDFETAAGEFRHYQVSLSLLVDDGEFQGTVVVAQDVTEIRQHERRLSVLDRVFRHNVRNRLNVVTGHLAELIDSEDERTAEVATKALGAADDLHELTESARRFQRSIRPGNTEVDAVDLTDTVRRMVEAARTKHPDATIRSDLPEAAVARAPRTLAFALEELLDNAVLHAASEPVVEVSVRDRAERVEIRIADNGPGIPADTRRVLQRGSETQLEHTLGLGLWLVRWTVSNVGGSITIEDNEPSGTVVVLRLPAADQSDAART